jgi:hypothetical protein
MNRDDDPSVIGLTSDMEHLASGKVGGAVRVNLRERCLVLLARSSGKSVNNSVRDWVAPLRICGSRLRYFYASRAQRTRASARGSARFLEADFDPQHAEESVATVSP